MKGEDKTGKVGLRHKGEGLCGVLRAGPWSFLLRGMLIFTITLCGRCYYFHDICMNRWRLRKVE